MKYRRMPIEIESPEQFGYDRIRCNLTESSVPDFPLEGLDIDLCPLILAYTDHLGKPALRELISSDGNGLDLQDVIVTPSAAAALFIVSTSILEKGDHMVVMHPNYATNIETPHAIGCKVDLLELSFENGFRFEIDRLAELIRPETKLISLTTPHNPTGITLSDQDLVSVAALAESRGCYLLVDETYRELNFNGPSVLASSISLSCISVASMSKSYGLPGIRIGWIITQNTDLRETFLAAKEQIFICNSVIDEEIAFYVLSRKKQILTPILANAQQGFNMMRKWMNDQSLMEWVEPSGGVVCFPRIKNMRPEAIESFYSILNEKYQTYVGPGHWFGMDRRYMRIGFAWPDINELNDGLNNIHHALEQVNNH